MAALPAWDTTPDENDYVLMGVGGEIVPIGRTAFTTLYLTGSTGGRPDKYDRVLMVVGNKQELIDRSTFMTNFLGGLSKTRPDKYDAVMMVIGRNATPVGLADFTASGWGSSLAQMAGTAAIQIAPAGAMTTLAPAQLAGTATITLATTGSATLKAQLITSPAIVLAATGALTANSAAQMAGTALITVAPTGALTAAARLASQSDIIVAPTGAASLIARLAAAPAITVAPTGSATLSALMTGTSAIALATTGALKTPPVFKNSWAGNLAATLTGVAAGDYLVASVTLIATSVDTITPPAGWTVVATRTWNVPAAYVGRQTIYQKVATGSEGTQTWSGTGVAGMPVMVTSWTNVDAAVGVEASAGTGVPGNAVTPIATAQSFASVTSLTTSAMILAFGYTADNSGTTPGGVWPVTGPAGYTQVLGTAASSGLSYKAQTTPGASGSLAVTLDTDVVAWSGFTLSLKAA